MMDIDMIHETFDLLSDLVKSRWSNLIFKSYNSEKWIGFAYMPCNCSPAILRLQIDGIAIIDQKFAWRKRDTSDQPDAYDDRNEIWIPIEDPMMLDTLTRYLPIAFEAWEIRHQRDSYCDNMRDRRFY